MKNKIILMLLLAVIVFASCKEAEAPHTQAEPDNKEEIGQSVQTEQTEQLEQVGESIQPTQTEQSLQTIAELVQGPEYVFKTTDFYSRDSLDFCSKYTPVFYGIGDTEARLVDAEKLQSWREQFNSGKRSLWECNLLTIVQELEIPEDELLNANFGDVYTKEQLKTLYSGDMKKINEAFVNPYALIVDGEIFTPVWLAIHTVGDYYENGITFEILQEYLPKIDMSVTRFACVPIALKMKEMNASFSLDSVEQLKEIEYDPRLYVVPDEIYNVLTKEEYENWANQFVVEGNHSYRDFNEFNLVNLIEETGISPEDLEEAVEVEYELKDRDIAVRESNPTASRLEAFGDFCRYSV